MTDTRHLDTAIAILKGTEGSKRAKRKAQVELSVEVYAGGYTIQMNGRLLETGSGDREYALARAKDREERIKGIGKTVKTKVT